MSGSRPIPTHTSRFTLPGEREPPVVEQNRRLCGLGRRVWGAGSGGKEVVAWRGVGLEASVGVGGGFPSGWCGWCV